MVSLAQFEAVAAVRKTRLHSDNPRLGLAAILGVCAGSDIEHVDVSFLEAAAGALKNRGISDVCIGEGFEQAKIVLAMAERQAAESAEAAPS